VVARRGFLAGATALALSGCGRSAGDDEPGGKPQERTATSRRGDIELLQAALLMELEQQAVHEDGFRDIERVHAARLTEALRALGAEPSSQVSTQVVSDATEVEGRAIAFYLDMLPKVYDAKLRSLIASILVVEAEQLAELRARAGRPPAPDAFVYGFQA
jgi:hypothetical protein